MGKRRDGASTYVWTLVNPSFITVPKEGKVVVDHLSTNSLTVGG